jgi:penicillin-binding protein 2
LCLVSSPSFDIHLYDNGISSADYKRLDTDPLKPMFNRAIAGAYEPGSTYKIVTTIAAQIGGVFDEHRRVTCNQTYRLGNRAWKCLGRHGSVDFRAAMAASCNVYFYDLAMRAGQKNLQEAMRVMGIGQRQGIDLPGEIKGNAPTPEWLAKYDAKWQPYYNLNVGIGQGDLSLTPLQMLSVVSTVANDGRAYKPHLLKASRSPDSTFKPVKPQAIIDLGFSPSFWNTMREGLFGVIDHGTAGVARIDGINWGGKTGSAQNSHGPMAHGWFVGFAPIEDPKIAIAVIVENGGHGGVVAAPVAKQIVEKYLKGNMSLTPNVQSTVRPLQGQGPRAEGQGTTGGAQ